MRLSGKRLKWDGFLTNYLRTLKQDEEEIQDILLQDITDEREKLLNVQT